MDIFPVSWWILNPETLIMKTGNIYSNISSRRNSDIWLFSLNQWYNISLHFFIETLISWYFTLIIQREIFGSFHRKSDTVYRISIFSSNKWYNITDISLPVVSPKQRHYTHIIADITADLTAGYYRRYITTGIQNI